MKSCKNTFLTLIFFSISFLSLNISSLDRKPPEVTVIFVIDQFAFHYLPRLKPYLTQGIGFLMQNGINYVNAYYPHAMPSTAVGHTALNTGTFATNHGIMNNSWRDGNLKKVSCVDAPAETAAVFSPTGFYDFGKSAHLIMMDGISDQLVLESKPNKPISVYAVSNKCYAAITCAGKLGKPLWFDAKSGQFTSSKANFDTLPEWLAQFNKTKCRNHLNGKKCSVYKNTHPHAYSMVQEPATVKQRIVNGVGSAIHNKVYQHDEPFMPFGITTQANALLLDLAKDLILHELRQKNNRIIVWISLSPLDKLCHFYGPFGKKTIDMIYHLDYQIKDFMSFLSKHVNPTETFYALTADHGVEPIPENIQATGITSAKRVIIPTLMDNLQTHILAKLGINIKCTIKTPQLYFDKSFNTLDAEKQKEVIEETVSFLKNQDGIKTAWSNQELKNKFFHKSQIEFFYQQQQFPNRSGQITFQVFPFVQMTKYPAGTAHRTPYEWNRHVALILYQKGTFEHKTIYDRVWLTQFANTIAEIHQVPKPSGSTSDLLPGVFPTKL